MGGKLTDAERQGLSDDEIAAIESEDGDDLDDLKSAEELEAELAAEEAEAKAKEEADAKAKAEADAEADAEAKLKAEQEAAGKTDEEIEADAKAKADAEASSAAEDGGEKTPEQLKAEQDAAAEKETEQKADVIPFVPKLSVIDDETFNSLKTAYDVAQEKFDNGDIDYAELDKAKDAYQEAKWKKEFAEETNAAQITQRWEWEQDRFMDDNEYIRDNKTLRAAFAVHVNDLIVTDEGKAMSDRQVLEAAKEKMEKDLGIVRSSDDTADETERKKKDAVNKAKKAMADKSKINPDLTDIPAAEENTEENEFDWLDRLDGQALENALAKLTPAQQARYEDAR